MVVAPLLCARTWLSERTGRDWVRLLEAAADSSESERRRIARDLHDGVVQELAGTSFALSAAARDPGTDPGMAQRLTPMAGALRANLRSLRSLLVEIYPPDLRADGLEAALGDLVATASTHGITPVVEVYDVSDAPEDDVRLVWRVAQEAVRNTLRHADATTLTIQVGRARDRLTLDVTDDGVGFDTRGQSSGLGLRTLRDLAAEVGGCLDVRSTSGHGTTVHLEVG
ncbi:hypothetical protein BH10ACT10_BH10ACT10_06300 [soil metagenome]